MRDARARTGVPGVAAGARGRRAAVVRGRRRARARRDEPVRRDTPFRIASISKPFTATLALACLPSSTTRLRALAQPHRRPAAASRRSRCPRRRRGCCRTRTPATGRPATRAAAACGRRSRTAMRARVLEPLGLDATGYDEPDGAGTRARAGRRDRAARRARRRVPVARRPSGGLWSTVADLAALRRSITSTRSAALHERARAQAARRRATRSAGGCATLGGGDRARPRGVGRRLPVAPPARAGASGSCSRCSRTAGAAAARSAASSRRSTSRRPRRRPRAAPDSDVAGVYALDGVEATIDVDERRPARDRERRRIR